MKTELKGVWVMPVTGFAAHFFAEQSTASLCGQSRKVLGEWKVTAERPQQFCLKCERIHTQNEQQT